MRKPPKTLVLALSVIGVAILGAALETLRFAGAFRTVNSEFAGSCRAIPLENALPPESGSSEDIQIDRERGVAYLSYLDRVRFNAGEPTRGTIKLLDLKLAEPAPRAALRVELDGFHPHGLSLWTEPGRPARLFAISHVRKDKEEAVEIFDDESGALVHRATIRDNAFVHPNAIAAIGPDAFYLVNDHPRQPDERVLADALLRKGTGSLVFHDDTRTETLLSDLRYPVGLALSPDFKRLYIAEAGRKALRIFHRDPASGRLDLDHPEVVDLGTAPDNLSVDDQGVIWMAAHPKLLKFLLHGMNHEKPAPTQVLRFDPNGPEPRLRTVYLNDGAQISAGSVAARWRDEFLIGAVLDPKVLICKPR